MSLLARGLRRRQSGGAIAVADVFATALYTGNGSTQTITNGIDLAGKGGMVWTKARNNTFSHEVTDTVRGAFNRIITNMTQAQDNSSSIGSFADTGFSLRNAGISNVSNTTYASWTFRKAPRFFDVVTYTGNGVAGRQVAHGLGVAPGMLVVKQTNASGQGWQVWSVGAPTQSGTLNAPDSFVSSATAKYFFGNDSSVIAPTDSVFTVGGSNAGQAVNANGATYIAYLFAHDPDGVIQCGSYTGNAAIEGPIIDLGWEPQYLLIKNTSNAYNWQCIDTARRWPIGSDQSRLYPNTSDAEFTNTNWALRLSNGFQLINGNYPEANSAGDTYIYLAIKKAS